MREVMRKKERKLTRDEFEALANRDEECKSRVESDGP